MSSETSPPRSPGVPPSRFVDQLASLLHALFTQLSSFPSSISPGQPQENELQEFTAFLSQTSVDHPYQASPGMGAMIRCKQLAAALVEYMDTVAHSSMTQQLLKSDPAIPSIPILNSRALDMLITLMKVMQCVKFQLHVQEPYFSQLKDGLKTVEGRCAAGGYSRLAVGDVILFNESLTQEVKAVHRYVSFEEMLKTEGLRTVLPSVKTLTEGVMVYRRFYTEEKEWSEGVLGIHVQNIPEERQPLTILQNILKVMNWSVSQYDAVLNLHLR